MSKSIAYEKLTNNIKQEYKELKLEIDTIPDINPINMLFCFVQHNFLNPNQIKDIYDRLIKLKSKAQNGLDYYEMANEDPSIEVINDNNKSVKKNKESEEQGYYSILIDLLVDINLLEKCLAQKDIKRFLEHANKLVKSSGYKRSIDIN